MRPFRGNAPLAWICVAGFLFAVTWRHFSAAELPLAGLRAVADPRAGWPLTLASLAMALFLSIPALITKERLLVCAGFSLCLFLGTVVYVSPVAAILFIFLSANLVREARALDSAPTAEPRRDASFQPRNS